MAICPLNEIYTVKWAKFTGLIGLCPSLYDGRFLLERTKTPKLPDNAALMGFLGKAKEAVSTPFPDGKSVFKLGKCKILYIKAQLCEFMDKIFTKNPPRI